jgi:gluconate kinase
MLDSQLNTLEEPPSEGEKGIVTVNIDAEEEEVSRRALAGVKKELSL